MILDEIRKELLKNVDAEYKKSIKRFFKEDQEINYLGVRTAVARKIGKEYWKKIKDRNKEEIIDLCTQMLEKGMGEEMGVAFSWTSKNQHLYKLSDFQLFTTWLIKYVKNWGSCDAYCGYVLGPFVQMYPEYLAEIKKWTGSDNRWVRRASAVLMITLLDNKLYLNDVFEIADLLLMDKDDMVQKGYGWMLKVASQHFQKEVFSYVMKHKDHMPRTALRYAIEKMPADMKTKAMH